MLKTDFGLLLYSMNNLCHHKMIQHFLFPKSNYFILTTKTLSFIERTYFEVNEKYLIKKKD